ncbi:unnamed protein product [Discula destructiva]
MEGYAKVAGLMAKYDNLAIFRGFKRLNYQNLLYLQAEIIHLEDTLKELANTDATHPDCYFHSKDWWSLAHGEDKNGKAQWRKFRKIRDKLAKYNDALLKQVALTKLEGPNPIDLQFLRHWFERPYMGAYPIRGLDLVAWDDTADLVAVKPTLTTDPLSRWLTNTFFPTWRGIFAEKFKTCESPELGSGICYYQDTLLVMTINIFATVTASLLPVLSIVVLSSLETFNSKMLAIVIFSACFALALYMMTTARRAEVFAATAAFAAVNVVFLTSSVPLEPT